MSDAPQQDLQNEEKVTPVKRRPWWIHVPVRVSFHVSRVVVWIVLVVVGVTALGLLTLNWYTKTDDFQRRVGGQVRKVLEDSTGGRVELGHLGFDLWHLAIEVDGLVVHGLEGPGEAPYLAADKILVRVKIHTFLKRATGATAAEDPGSHIGLNLLRVEQPRVHLIIDKDGKTNQPTPKKADSNTPVMDTLLDLEANKVEMVNGVALVNDKAIPFQMAANQLQANVRYLSHDDHYGATLDMNDLRTKIANEPEAQSKLHLEAEVGRDVAELKALQLLTGAASKIEASGRLEHFANPVWQGSATGTMELKQIGVLAGVDGFTGGTIALSLQGHSCAVAPAVAQKRPHFWQRKQAAQEQAAGVKKTLPPAPECEKGYLLAGGMKVRGAGFSNPLVRAVGVNASADLQVTPVELLFTALTGELPNGGKIFGQMRIENWLGEVPVDAPARSATTVAAATTANTAAKGIGAKAPITSLKAPSVEPAHAYMDVQVTGLTLRTVMDMVAPEHYGDLGLDTTVNGPVKVEWGGTAKDIESSVKVDGDLKFLPSGMKRAGATQNVPVTGTVLAHYTGVNETVNIERLRVSSPESALEVSGILGVNKGDPLTNVRVDLQAHDLGEFDSLLQTLGFEENGKKGTAAIPVVLHGQAEFQGTAVGAVRNLEVKGHVEADHVEAKFGSAADFLVDSAVGDADYSPSRVSIATSTIQRGSAVLNVSGTFTPRTVVDKHGVVDYAWDKDMSLDAQVKLANAPVQDVLQLAGQQQKLALTGMVNFDGHAQGTPQQLNGAGHLALANGVAYGEPYQSANVSFTVNGKDLEVSSATAVLHGMTISGNGGYDMASEKLHGHVQGSGLVLSKFVTVQKEGLKGDGVLSVTADADGTLQQPNLKADVKLASIKYDGQAMGDAAVEAHSQGSTLYYSAHATLVGAAVTAEGQTALTGDYQTQAKVNVSGADIGRPLAMFGMEQVKASSSIAGTVTVQGPLKTPTALSGLAELNSVDVKLQGIELKSAEPLRASLRNGVATLEQVHITGEDTDLHAQGTVQLFGTKNPNGGNMNLRANGNISMALAHTFDKDLIASGRVVFTVAAGGQLKKPSLTGTLRAENVNLAIDGVPNGLSNMNGTLRFYQDRLQVEQLTATTGGGQLKLGGFLTYQNGAVYANLTAIGETVRVRLYGLSATANANFTLTGGPQNLLLSGNVLITRFGVGQNVDFAAFSGAGGVTAPPDPDAASNKVQLDVHITSSPQLDFQNSYAKLAGTVDLTVRGTLAAPSVLGRIRITDGSATFAGTKYQVQRGDIYFTNPVRIDPIIDLDVTSRVENYDITVGLHGTTTEIKPTYRSEPPLSEADIFNLLALGRTQEEAQLYQEQQIQAGTDPTTSALLGGALNATVSSRVSKLFGAGSVKIDPAFVGTLGNSAARITVQEPLGRQLTLTFATNVNQSAQQLIQLQYQINPSMAVVMTRDESGVFSIVYKIRKRYR